MTATRAPPPPRSSRELVLEGIPRSPRRADVALADALCEEPREVEGHERRRTLVALAQMVAGVTWHDVVIIALTVPAVLVVEFLMSFCATVWRRRHEVWGREP